MNLRWLPNAITVLRMVMAAPLLWLLGHDDFRLAFWLALVAGASDALDGFLARRFGWRSALGGLLDPAADKLLLGVCFFGLWWHGHLPGWLAVLVFGRDLVILAGALLWWRRIGPFQPAPSPASKLTTFLQIVLVLSLLLALAGSLPATMAPTLAGLTWATALATAVSGIDYVARWSLRARRALERRK